MSSEPTELGEIERVSPPFRQDKLAHLWIVTRAMSSVTDTIWSIGLAWTAVQVGSPATAGVVLAAGTIPRAVLLVLGGAVADRFDVRRVMVASNIGRLLALAAVISAAATVGPSYSLLIVSAGLLGACDALYEPSAATIARQIVHPSDIPAYIGMYQTVGRLGELFGSAAGGLVVAHWAIQGTAILNLVAFGGVLLFVAFYMPLRYPIAKVESGSILRGVVRSFTHLKGAQVTRTLVMSQMLLNVFIVPALGLGVVLRARELGLGAEVVGYVGMAVGIGGTIGALVSVRFKPERPALMAYTLFTVEGLAIVSLGTGGIGTLFAGAVVMGLCAGAASAMLGGVFISQVRAEYTGRMIALVRLGDECLMPMSTVAFGVIVTVSSASIGLTVFGALMVIAMVLPLTNARIRRISAR